MRKKTLEKKSQMNQDYFKNINVYKTNIEEQAIAEDILHKIRTELPDSDPSFDLEDCDKVLRVETKTKPVDDLKVRNLVKASGYQIEHLP